MKLVRIKFGTWILSCSLVSRPGGDSELINAATRNGLYTIVFDTVDEAVKAYNQLLINGYYDASDNQYSN